MRKEEEDVSLLLLTSREEYSKVRRKDEDYGEDYSIDLDVSVE